MAAIRAVEQHPELCYVLLHRAPVVYLVLVVDVLEECQCGPLGAVLNHRAPVLPDIIIAEPA